MTAWQTDKYINKVSWLYIQSCPTCPYSTNWIQTYSVMLEVSDNTFVSCLSIDVIACKDLKKYLQIINKKSSVFNSEKQY